MIDTHTHIHSKSYELSSKKVLTDAQAVGLKKLLVIGVDDEDSKVAIKFAQAHEGVWATVGLHPHDAKFSNKATDIIDQLASQYKVVAIGEIGLDYYYQKSKKEEQLQAFEDQLKIAQEHKLPLVLHLRGTNDDPTDVFSDCWRIYDKFSLPGVVHSFTANSKILNAILERNLYVSLNGIVTFSSDNEQLSAARIIPIDKLLLETDSPFLTPPPYRGKINQPKYVELVADFIATIRSETKQKIIEQTTINAESLFSI